MGSDQLLILHQISQLLLLLPAIDKDLLLHLVTLTHHIYWGNSLEIDERRVVWRRVMDMNDRALRDIVTSLGGVSNGFPRQTGFDITVASEVMAILCLATDLEDLQKRLGDIIVAYRRDKSPIYCRDIKADGAMTVLLKDAMQPNLVQTLENNPAFVHGGPFANIAHGCNSVMATTTALKIADYVVTGSSAEKGSSKNQISGSMAKLLAIPTRCCCPPDNSLGKLAGQPALGRTL